MASTAATDAERIRTGAMLCPSSPPESDVMRSNKARGAIVATALCAAETLFAYSEERALHELGLEYADCAAYFQFMSIADPTQAGRYQLLASSSASLAGRLADMDAAAERWSAAFERMRQVLAENRAQLGGELAAHHERCAALLDDGESRLQYWLERND